MFDYICDPPKTKDFDSDREVLNNLIIIWSLFAWYLMNISKYIIEWSLLSAYFETSDVVCTNGKINYFTLYISLLFW